MVRYEVNRNDEPDTITVRYLAKSHTFMSANSSHHQTEKAMKQMKNVKMQSSVSGKGTSDFK